MGYWALVGGRQGTPISPCDTDARGGLHRGGGDLLCREGGDFVLANQSRGSVRGGSPRHPVPLPRGTERQQRPRARTRTHGRGERTRHAPASGRRGPPPRHGDRARPPAPPRGLNSASPGRSTARPRPGHPGPHPPPTHPSAHRVAANPAPASALPSTAHETPPPPAPPSGPGAGAGGTFAVGEKKRGVRGSGQREERRALPAGGSAEPERGSDWGRGVGVEGRRSGFVDVSFSSIKILLFW